MIKTMNNKMAIIHIYQQLNLNNKLSKHEEQRQNMDTESILIVARWEAGMGEEVRGLISTSG